MSASYLHQDRYTMRVLRHGSGAPTSFHDSTFCAVGCGLRFVSQLFVPVSHAVGYTFAVLLSHHQQSICCC